VLQRVFELLYTRLGFLHEATGRMVYGAAWDGRRRLVIPPDSPGILIDLGCGEGRLLRKVVAGGYFAVGIEPSRQMAERAARRDACVIQARSQAIPVRSSLVQSVVSTYPGPWIIEPDTWNEIARVTKPGATVTLLLGGDYKRGRWAAVRRRVLRLAYGNAGDTSAMPSLGHPLIEGAYQTIDDDWGTAILWSGIRREDEAERLRD